MKNYSIFLLFIIIQTKIYQILFFCISHSNYLQNLHNLSYFNSINPSIHSIFIYPKQTHFNLNSLNISQKITDNLIL
jgi:hypothetical protein